SAWRDQRACPLFCAMRNVAGLRLLCGDWPRAWPAVWSAMWGLIASSRRCRQQLILATLRRIIFHLVECLKPRAMHAKPRQDGTAPAVLWLEATKTRCASGRLAEEDDHDAKNQAAISRRS